MCIKSTRLLCFNDPLNTAPHFGNIRDKGGERGENEGRKKSRKDLFWLKKTKN